MTVSKYAVAVSQLENYGALHPDTHIFFMKMQEGQTDIITEIMTQISLKARLK